MRLSEGMSTSSVRLELALLSHLYTIAIKEWGMGLVVNPVSNIRKPKPAKGRDRRLVGSEEERLLNACESHSNPMVAWVVKLAIYTAMRHSEIINITREQVNLSRRSIFLAGTKNGDSRTVPLTNKALDVIQEAINGTCEDLELKLGKVGPPLRLAVAGTPMSPGLDITLNLVGRERTLQRLGKAIETIKAMA